jgi:hypothetical protein
MFDKCDDESDGGIGADGESDGGIDSAAYDYGSNTAASGGGRTHSPAAAGRREASNDQQDITGIGFKLFECPLLFSIRAFHTFSFLCHPVECTEVISFWTLH